LGKVVVAYDKKGKPVTTTDLEVAGAMCAWMRNTINPTLMSTTEYQPCMVHAGPFANIAVGQSSIIADRIGLKMFDYHVTESGFAADIGFEKFWNVKCRLSGLIPNVSILTATIRALKMHGGGPKVVAGLPIPEEYSKENLGLLEKGIANMIHLIGVIKKSGINPVVCINAFHTDTKDEIAMVRKYAEQAGARCASIGLKVGMAPLSLPMLSWRLATTKLASNSSIPLRCLCGSESKQLPKRYTELLESPGLQRPKPKPNGLRPILH
jgi:formate--tetrahydrofolate ligase